MLPFSYIGSGTYTNPATLVTQNIALSDQPDWFFVKDLTNWGKVSGGNYVAANPVYAEWFSNMAAGSFLGEGQAANASGAAALFATQGTSGGFTFINTTNPPLFASLAGTTVDKTAFTVLMTNTGSIAVGDTVRLTNVVGMQQISGYTFGVTAVSANTSITLGYMATAVAAGLTIAANGTACTVTKVIPNKYYPKLRRIAFVQQATTPKVYFTEPNLFTIGEIVDFLVPTPYGMVQLSSLTKASGGAPTVLTVTNTATESSITINLNTTGFSAFVFPSSANIFTSASPAVCVPAGSGIVPLNGSLNPPASPPGTNLADAFDNQNQFIMQIGTSACGVASAVMQWFAFKSDFTNLSNA